MDDTEQKKLPKEICTIKIMFPVDTDEQAIEYKKKIGEILADMPNAQIQFALMPPPVLPAGLRL